MSKVQTGGIRVMRYGLLALSMVMLGGGGFAAQSALAITVKVTSAVAASPEGAPAAKGDKYGSLPFTADRARPLRIAQS